MLGNVEVQHEPPIVGKHDEDEENVEGHRGNGKEVDRHEILEVVDEESSPGLGWRSPPTQHVLRHSRLRDLDAQLEKFAVNPRCSPERVRAAHPAQEGPDLRVDPWPARAAASAFPVPVVLEPLSVPADDRFWLNDHQRSFPVTPSEPKESPESSIEVSRRREDCCLQDG